MLRMELAGKTALVTGAARRVGRAIAEELAGAGARVVVHHHRSTVEAQALVERLGAVLVRADLRRPEAAREVVDEALAATGRLDIVVNSAGDYGRTPLAELADERWSSMLALNLDAPLRLTRNAVAAGAVAIINVVDVAAWQPGCCP